MLITGKKRPFCFVLKQEKPLIRGKNAVFHIKTPHKRVGEESPCLQPCPSLRRSRAFLFTSSWSVATGSIHFIPSFDRGKSSVTPSCGRSPPRNAPAPLQKKRRGRVQRILSIGMSSIGWSRGPMVLLSNRTDKRKIVYSESFRQRTETPFA